jgi:hypothetical protein
MHISVHRAQKMSFLRPVAWTALLGLEVDEQERRVLRGKEMIGERIVDGGTGHGSGTFS